MNKEQIVKLVEHNSHKYAPRTYHNASSANFTIALAYDMSTAGEILTKKAAGESYIGFAINKDKIMSNDFVHNVSQTIVDKIKNAKMEQAVKLNFAGNGIYTLNKNKISQNDINLFVYKVIKEIIKEINVIQFLSGGQTGVDFACAVACLNLNQKATITFPKGFLQRFENEKDINQTHEEVYQYLIKNNDELNNLLKKQEEIIKQTPIKRKFNFNF